MAVVLLLLLLFYLACLVVPSLLELLSQRLATRPCTVCSKPTSTPTGVCVSCGKLAWEEEKRREEEATKVRAEQFRKDDEERRRQLAEHAKSRQYLLDLTPQAFESYSAQLFAALGYTVQLTPASRDAGVDAYLKKEGYTGIIQCKHFTKGNVSRPDLQKFFGVLIHEKAKEGFFLTTGRFTPEALVFVKGKRINLIDIDKLIDMGKGAFSEDFIRSGPKGITSHQKRLHRARWGRRYT